ncbi:cytidylyltransferase domain-containing protein [Fluviispira sanaruensis]|uniref:Acylneuraminate cytidylyltransferase family protein n=1 Tax=Fluviispira sanaruensis TaxID=2493639 RepID=A0A4P2VWT3_FLUSA|nr:acylneuraminate cytidylyltransferase family protein [Fluviispira sanaruensis]BBH54075.1 acylneuraminate cytidylyltransferase family protein [Fluviispira sanaruensis]
METLAIIPARKGSKGLPGKNKKYLCGKPLIAYSIESALEANLTPFISTDDEEIIQIANKYNIICNYRRPQHLATDSASMVDVVLDAINWIEDNLKQKPEIITLLQPTSPFRTFKDINESIKLLKELSVSSVIGISKMWEHPFECIKIKENGGWEYLRVPPVNIMRRQDYKSEYYFINGAIYTFKKEFFIKEKRFLSENSKLLFMSEQNSCDIDSYKDFYLAEALMKSRNL